MATAKKKSVDNNKGREFSLQSKDIVEVADFGSFEVVATKSGVMFKTHTGFHVWCTPYVLDLEGKAHENNLYAWLTNLIEAKKSFSGEHQDEIIEDAAVSKGEMLDVMKIITEANMTHPITAFVDIDSATKFANERIEWLGKMQSKLSDALSAEVKEETQDDIKSNFEHGANEIEKDSVISVLQEASNGGGTGTDK